MKEVVNIVILVISVIFVHSVFCQNAIYTGQNSIVINQNSTVPGHNTTVSGNSTVPGHNTTVSGNSTVPSHNSTVSGNSTVPGNSTAPANSTVPGSNNTDVNQNKSTKFPAGFLFGAASSAVQVEGAWNIDGKGPSGWDEYQTYPGVVVDNSTDDVACDSYHLAKGDIPFLKMAGMNAYRFSLSWPRLLPTGATNNVNQKGVDYYNDLINELLSYNITPVVTMYHWDLPLNLTKLGGWTNVNIIDSFVSYADFVLKTFGDRVKYWITFNEPNQECVGGYGSVILSPGLNMSGTADYLCGHNKLLAHASVYRLYKLMPSNIKEGGMMGFTVGYPTYYPWNSLLIPDYEAAELANEFLLGWFLDPVFGTGNYPVAMQEVVAFKSFKEGRKTSRLPQLTPAQTLLVKGSADFLGISQYTGFFSSFLDNCPNYTARQYFVDLDVYSCHKPGYAEAGGGFFQVVPGSMKKALADIREKYKNPAIIITENGYPDLANENLKSNPARQSYFQTALSEVLASIDAGSKVLGYITWSLLDSFEWNSGYTLKFGMVHVDFTSKNKTRTPKPIINFFKNFSEYGLNVTTSS